LRLRAWFYRGPRYPIEPLRKELRETFCIHKLGDCKKPVILPATTLDTYALREFTNLTRNGLRESPDNGLLAADVAMASSAGPLYFPAVKKGPDAPHTPGDPRTYVDGGIWANTPSLIAIMQAHRHLGIPFDQMRVLSIGNGEVPDGKVGVDFNKLRRMRMVSPILDMMFAAQARLADETVRNLIGEQNLLRVTPPLKEPIDLDDMEKARSILGPRAVEDALNGGQKVREFLGIQ
jgi:patatin-like phospholipase/acyl hydrolase